MKIRENVSDCNIKKPVKPDEDAVIRKLSWVSIIGNIILSAFKITAGIAGKSGAMISDAVHSLSDVLTTIIAFWGVRLSKKAADREHPYGHERLECVASLILGIILLAVGVGIGRAGLNNIIFRNYEKLAVPGTIALIAAVLSIVVKEAMYWYTIYYARIIRSAAFMADAWHHRSDAFSSVGALAGIGGAMLGFPVLDSVGSVVICLFILKASCDILWDSLKKMLDTSCGEDYEKKLAEYISSQEDVVRIDLLRTRMFGNKVYIDLEIAVAGDKSLWDAHAVAERVHDNVEAYFTDAKHVMIHVNPAAQKPDGCRCISEQTQTKRQSPQGKAAC